MEKKTREELVLLTDRLSEKQDVILKTWEHKMRESTAKSTVLASMSRKEFYDNIPAFLKRFYDGLLGKDIDTSDIGEIHGSQRWEHGFNLLTTVKEWGVLQKVIRAEIASLRKELDLTPEIVSEAYAMLITHIQESIEYSVQKFDNLQRRETEAQMRDLEMVLQIPKEISRNNDLRGTSHDLKGMVKNLQMGFFLLEDEDMSERASEILNQMSIAADNLEQLLNDMLDLFRLETQREKVNLSEFDAAKTLRELCSSMQPIAKKENLELNCSGIDSLPVKSDEKKLQRIARNLLLNALKYTEMGHIDVHWEKRPDKQWLLEISDTGPGLSATHAKSLTRKAERQESEASELEKPTAQDGQSAGETKSHGEGIGLLIVRHLCKLLDAIIEVDTAPGEGTSFKIIFPLSLKH